MTDTPSTAVERHQLAQPTLANDQRYMANLPVFARQFSNSGMCPEAWRAKPIPAGASEQARTLILSENEQKIADLCVVGQTLAELDIRFAMTVLPQIYVVKGRPGFMAQLQILLAARFGIPIVPLDDESDAESASVKIIGKDKQWHRVTVTMAEAKLARWPERNPNYATMPDRMLMARAVTKAIDRHAPEVKMMLPPADLEEAFLDVEAELEPFETGETIRIADGKGRVLEAVMAAGQPDRKAAAVTASLLWSTHDLPSGDGRVPRSQVDELITKIPAAVPDQPPAATVGAPDEPVETRTAERGQEEPSLMDQLDASLAKARASAVDVESSPSADSDPPPVEYGPDEEPFLFALGTWTLWNLPCLRPRI